MALLSICIPTYNHAEYLAQMLARLTALPTFAGGEVEVVISDNASTDSTQSVAERYAAEFCGRVKYFRNPKNVFDGNFALALSRGTGEFLKLANDTLLFTDDGLAEMLASVRRHLDAKPVLFFANDSDLDKEVECGSFDDLWREISFHCTWIGSFGLWKTDFDAIPDFARYHELLLTQVDVLCRLMATKRHAVVNHVKFANMIPRSRLGGYNLAQVFGRNYCTILAPYVKSGMLSRRAFRREKHQMLRHHILPFYLSFGAFNGFPKNGYVRYLLRDWWTSPFFWSTVLVVLFAEMVWAVIQWSRR